MYCSECGTEQTELAKFCSSCGNEVKPVEPSEKEYEQGQLSPVLDEEKLDGSSVVVLIFGLFIVGVALFLAWWLGVVVLGFWSIS